MGNVYEWVADCHGAYDEKALIDPGGPTSGEKRVMRGGCWGSLPHEVRVSFRDWFVPSSQCDFIGFRCAGN